MPELAVIVPTFNELGNVLPMVEALEHALRGIDFELIFVDDDSPDGTADAVREASRRHPHVRVIHRIHRRGLASAAVEGIMATCAPYAAVMDGDMQHDESVLPEMLRRLKTENLDIVIGTRNTEGGSMGAFSSGRIRLSNFGRRVSAFISNADVSDPMSGYFVVSRTYINEVVRSLSTVGFKILLDLLASSTRPVRFAEVGYTFRDRKRGESKLTATVCLEYIELLLDKLVGNWVPVRYVFFGFVGALGILAQLMLVRVVLYSLPFVTAQAVAAMVVMVLNYMLNNQLTFRARQRRGWSWLLGMVMFLAACSVGLLSNLSVARSLNSFGADWTVSSIAGIVVGSVWNYAVSSIFVWRVNRRHQRSRLRQPSPSYSENVVVSVSASRSS